jgi:hypothetical protein
MKISVGSTVQWVASNGMNFGVVTKIELSPAASGRIVPWVYVRIPGRATAVCLCGLDENLKAMQVELMETQEEAV